MLEWFVLKTYWIVLLFSAAANDYALTLMVVQAVNAAIVFAFFEYHWRRTADDDFYLTNIELIANADKEAYYFFMVVFAFFPFASIYMYGRSIYQRFDSLLFLNDYAVKRDD